MRGLIGKKLSHSFSKQIHEKLDHKEYNLIELSELDSFFQEKSFQGVNVTIPYKSDVIPFLDSVSQSAKEINAVNTIINDNGFLKGYNTDVDGLLYTFDYYSVTLKNKTIGILGNGATSRTIQYVMSLKNVKNCKVFARNPGDNEYPLNEISKHQDLEILIDATPVGMYPNNEQEAIVDVSLFPSLEFVLDLVYNPLRTNLILQAETLNIKAANGLMMLIHQAVRANELFNKINYDKSVTDNLYKEIYLSQLNVVLIGMPMSGKSFYSKKIALKYDKELIDIDKEIEYTQKKSIPEIFNEYGENEFRTIENQTVLSVSKQLNKAISTGGGVVLNPNNINALKQNGVVIFIDVPIEDLKKMKPKNRPLLKDPKNLENLYRDRYNLYNECCDIKVVKNGFNATKTMRKIEVKINEYIDS